MTLIVMCSLNCKQLQPNHGNDTDVSLQKVSTTLHAAFSDSLPPWLPVWEMNAHALRQTAPSLALLSASPSLSLSICVMAETLKWDFMEKHNRKIFHFSNTRLQTAWRRWCHYCEAENVVAVELNTTAAAVSGDYTKTRMNISDPSSSPW